MCSRDNARVNIVNASTIGLNVPRLLELELGIKLEGIEASLSSCKLPNFDSIVEGEPKALILPLREKKKQNLKFVGFLRGAMVIVKTCSQIRHGRHQICSVFSQGMRLRKLTWQLIDYL
jgi:hypothetical protein